MKDIGVMLRIFDFFFFDFSEENSVNWEQLIFEKENNIGS